MKKLILCATGAIALIFAFTTGPAFAQTNGKAQISQFCSKYGDLGLSHGACMAFFVTSNIVPHNATICQSPKVQKRMGVDNPGQCVSELMFYHR